MKRLKIKTEMLRRNGPVIKSYSIDGSILPFADCIRDLGIHHDCRLKYDQHISNIVHNAYKCAALILKSFHSRDPQILKRAYCVYVRPLLEFSSHIWSPHYKYLIDKIESVQRYFTKRLFGLSKLSYCERLISIDLDTLERRRLIYDLISFFVIRWYTDCAIYLCLLTMHTRTHVVIVLKLINTSVLLMLWRKYFFSSRVIDACNSLSNDVVKLPSVCVFKKRLHNVNLDRFLAITYWLFLVVYWFCHCFF